MHNWEPPDNPKDNDYQKSIRKSLHDELAYGDTARFLKMEKQRMGANAEGFGICSQCENFEYVETEFTIMFARCFEMKITLKKNERVKRCTSFNEKGRMSLSEMTKIAYIIDDRKKEVGFMREDKASED